MKKHLSMLGIVALAASLAACGRGAPEQTNTTVTDLNVNDAFDGETSLGNDTTLNDGSLNTLSPIDGNFSTEPVPGNTTVLPQ